MAQDHNVTLTITTGETTREIDVWDRYTVTLSMFSAGQAWTFSFWSSTAANTTWEVLSRDVRLYSKVSLAIDGAPQLVGWLETLDRGTADERNSGLTAIVGGRDLAGPATDFDASPLTAVKGVPLQTALTDIFSAVGLPVHVTDAAAARAVQTRERRGANGVPTRRRRKRVDVMRPRDGESVWSYATSVVKRLGYMMWVAPLASGELGLVVDSPDYDQQPMFTFERNAPQGTGSATGNILSGREQFSARNVPTDVYVYTGTARGAVKSKRARYFTVNAKIVDTAITRGFTSPLLPVFAKHDRSQRARTLGSAEKVAERIIADAMKSFRRYVLRVQGHGQIVNGALRLYAINTTARVHDDYLIDVEGRALDEVMLISEVQFEGSKSGGQFTRITLIPRNSVKVTPEGGNE